MELKNQEVGVGERRPSVHISSFLIPNWCFGTVAYTLLQSYDVCSDRTSRAILETSRRKMNAFGDRIRQLRKAKGYSLRTLAPLVGVGFSYLSKVECNRLDFDGSPSESLIHRLADVLEADEDELLLLARHLPQKMADRIFEQPEVFRLLAQCDDRKLHDFANSCGITNPAPRRKRGG